MHKSPCTDCPDRHHGCHGSCAAYIEWAAERREIGRRESADRKTEYLIGDLIYRGRKKRRDKRG